VIRLLNLETKFLDVINLMYYFLFSEELISRHVSLTESEFDGITAEWLRFAKQRKDREDKAKQKNNEENNEQR